MNNFLDKIFFRSRNLDYISQNLFNLTNQTPANKIFEALNAYADNSEVRYVGGCVRKIIKKQIVDDIDLAMTKGVNYPKGLLQWSNEIGLVNVLKTLTDLQEEYGEDRYRPSPMLRKMAESNQTFF